MAVAGLEESRREDVVTGVSKGESGTGLASQTLILGAQGQRGTNLAGKIATEFTY